MVELILPRTETGFDIAQTFSECQLTKSHAQKLLPTREGFYLIVSVVALLENFVCMELRKQIAWSNEHPDLFHWRTHAQQEVDLVLESGGRLVGIEVKASSTVTADDFKGLRVLATEAKQRFLRGVLLYTGQEMLPFGDKLVAMPVSALWRLGL